MYDENYEPRFYSEDPETIDDNRVPIIKKENRFVLNEKAQESLRSLKEEFGFGEFGKAVYYRTYSRIHTEKDGSTRQEKWSDTIIRCVEGCMTYRKNHMINNFLDWDEEWAQKYAYDMAISAFYMQWLPPGRGLWAGGIEYTYERGGFCLNNCGYTDIDNLPADCVWFMDALMNGCGIGSILNFVGEVHRPSGNPKTYVIPDNREGWAHSTGLLINSYVANENGYLYPKVKFDYSRIRPKGLLLKGFGGKSSGPEPLIKLHKRIRCYFKAYLNFNEKIVVEADEYNNNRKLYRLYRKVELENPDEMNSRVILSENLQVFSDLFDKLRHEDYEKCSDEQIEDWKKQTTGTPFVWKNDNLFRMLRYSLYQDYSDQDFDGISLYIESMRKKSSNGCTTCLDSFENVISVEDRNSVGPYIRILYNLVKRTETEENGKTVPYWNFDRLTKLRASCKDNYFLRPYTDFIMEMVCNAGCLSDVDRFTSLIKKFEHGIKMEIETCENIRRRKNYNLTRLTADILNAIGCCVVAGNVRRSSEILGSSPDDQTFLDLKDYDLNPERQPIGGMSNNSAIFDKTEDFDMLPEIVKRVVVRGEPGFFNRINVRRYGRIGRYRSNEGEWTREYEQDDAVFSNPCGEIGLKNKELCCLSELIPAKCNDQTMTFSHEIFNKAIEYATFYASSVSLVPTHWACTNKVIAENRRIGVSITSFADWYDNVGLQKTTKYLREGYALCRKINRELARQAGVCESLRVTTVKPSGTVSLLAGVSSGMHFPLFKYAIRRVRASPDTPYCKVLIESGYPHEPDTWSDNSEVFDFYIDQGKTRPQNEVSMWEMFSILELLNREWSDNSVSNTITFKENEIPQLETALTKSAPWIKSCSLLPYVPSGVYAQSPYEEITHEKYEEMLSKIVPINWDEYGKTGNYDGECPKYCTNDMCTL